ncbi:hypothetical protein SAY87_018381 [Trapa incisa]|uniref:RING-type domain-containing protein n=1 Tax=Trapa incisa TaxID=236973 RepID=A0AAN7L5A8_9MYRT|nr:hypothetical protein SAY87_018381 [Trapa incisa]
MSVPMTNPAPPRKPPLVPPNPRTTFDCLLCMEENLPTSLLFTTTMRGGGGGRRCGHSRSICRRCLASYIKASVEAGNPSIRCPVHNCYGWNLDPITCRGLVSGEVFARWCDLLCESALLGYDRCYCPNKDCQELIVDECGDKRAKKIWCPGCRRSCCFRCAEPWVGRNGHKCERVEVVIGTEVLRRCPGCKYYVEKNGGCSVIHCRCWTQFCYYCGWRREPSVYGGYCWYGH